MKRLIISLILLGSARFSKAQSFTGSLSGSVSISSVQSLTLTGGSVIPSFQSLDDFANGVTVDDYLSVIVKSNVSWTVSVMAQNAHFSPMTQNGSTDMPASVLSIRSNNYSSYTALSTTAQTLKTGNKGSSNNPGNSFDIDIRYNPGFSYKGGIYTLGLVYTLSQQ